MEYTQTHNVCAVYLHYVICTIIKPKTSARFRDSPNRIKRVSCEQAFSIKEHINKHLKQMLYEQP